MKRRGMTLTECMAALAILGLALGLWVTLAAAGPRASRRLNAQREAFRALEGTLEIVRGGGVPLASADIPIERLLVPRAAKGLTVRVTVKPTPQRDLHEVHVEARYTSEGIPMTSSLDTLVWRRS